MNNVAKCTKTDVFRDGCLFKIGQLVRVPTIVTGVAMISMTVLEFVGVAISYGLLRSIAIRDGNIDFRAMFKEKMRIVNESISKPFKDGFAANMIEALRKRAASLDLVEEDGDKNVNEDKDNAEPAPIYLENHVGSLTFTEEPIGDKDEDTTLSIPSITTQT